MTDLNTQEQANEDVKVNSDSGANVETSNDNKSAAEIGQLKEEMRQTNKQLEDLIASRKSETSMTEKDKIGSLTKSIIEDSIVDPERAGRNLESLISSEAERAKKEALLQIRVEQESSSAINSVIAKSPKLAPLMEEIKYKAGMLIRANNRLTITDAINEASKIFNASLNLDKKEEEKKQESSNERLDGNTGNTSSNASVKVKKDNSVSLEQEISNREDLRLSKII